jgi:hypothetical protein
MVAVLLSDGQSVDVFTASLRGLMSNSYEHRTLTLRLVRWMRPYVFFFFVIVGFGLASVGGRIAVMRDYFGEFDRFHRMIGTETFYNPTALQLQRMLDAIPADKIVIVVGGTSRFNGVGQSPNGLWTKALQHRLGDRFHVINLALRAGRADAFGQQAGEMLLKSGRQVIYVADWMIGEAVNVLGTTPFYRYLFQDAYARHLLLPWPARDEALDVTPSNPSEAAQNSELRIRARLNAVFYFDDLWQVVGLRTVFFAAYFPIRHPFQPRGTAEDIDKSVPVDGYYSFYTHSEGMNTLRPWTSPLPKSVLSNVTASASLIPLPLRERMLLITNPPSPYYTKDLTSRERTDLDANFERYTAAWISTGISTVEIGTDWTSADYVDLIHISESGGVKLADAIAPLVVRKAKELNYVQ